MKPRYDKLTLQFDKFQDKVRACWIGKNIGGTMGGPYEHFQEVLDVKGYATPAGEPMPNDDLDLQLVWLYALEKLGPKAIHADTLGELWLSFITPSWNEYGIGKVNMERGLRPSMSGDFQNDWRHSNGAWIRTEIWACICPGLPSRAALYAVEDAKVDHGAGEGTFAAAFVAAMQAAAFVIGDLRKCIELGLAAIPEECRVAKSVKLVMDAYDSGKTWLEARNAVLESNADLGTGWFEAPSNVAYAVLGMIYGEGDFKKSMLTAINCGDDTDCTAATVGATMGILYGMEGIPADWMDHIGDEIITISLALGGMLRSWIPKTCTELTQRVVELTPHVLYFQNCAAKFTTVLLGDRDEIPGDWDRIMLEQIRNGIRPEMNRLKPFAMRFEEAYMTAELTLDREPVMEPNGELCVHGDFINSMVFENRQFPLVLRWILPEGFTAEGPSTVLLNRKDLHGKCTGTADFRIRAGDRVQPISRLILEVTVPGRHTALYASFLVFAG